MSRLSIDANYEVQTSEIDNISKMLSNLTEASKWRTHSYIGEAALSYPYIPGLVANKTGNAIVRKAFSGIDAVSNVTLKQVLRGQDKDNDLHAAHSILAGHGLGLCQPWTAEENCDCARNQGLLAEIYLLVGYYSYGVEVVLTEDTASIYDLEAYTHNNYSLGYSSKPSRENVDHWLEYWDDLRDFLRASLLKHPELEPRTLILYGDRSTDEHFQTVLDMVLRQMFGNDRPRLLVGHVDPVFAGALGAAELLKRKRFREVCWAEREG